MDEQPTKRGGGIVAAILVVVMLLLPIPYVLSIGPAQHFIGNSEAWNVIYGPLDAAAAACRPLAAR